MSEDFLRDGRGARSKRNRISPYRFKIFDRVINVRWSAGQAVKGINYRVDALHGITFLRILWERLGGRTEIPEVLQSFSGLSD